MSYVTDSGVYYEPDERCRAESLLDILLAQAHGVEVRHRRAGAYLAGGLPGLRRQPQPEFRSVTPAADRDGRAMLTPAGIEYR